MSNYIVYVVEELVKNKLSNNNINSNSLLSEYGMDSFKIIELIVEIEKIFNIEFKSEFLSPDVLKSIHSISEKVKEILNS